MKVIIVGGVAAGMSAAAKFRRLDKDSTILIYEKSDIISWGACGLPYYVGNFFENSDMMKARTIEDMKKVNIDVKINHEVIKVDPIKKTIQVKNWENGEVFEDNYDKLMISTGAHSILPPIKNIDTKGVFTLKEFSDGLNLKKEMDKEENQNIIIVGAGYIGLELLEACVNLKKKNIKVIQLGDRVLAESFDKEITDIMEEEIRGHEGVELLLQEMVLEIIEKDGKVVGIKTDKNEYKADLVVIATGVRPNTEFLKDSGINMLKNGALIIDKYGRTNIEDIYSGGDCASVYHMISNEDVYIPLGTTANKIGRIVGENLAGLNSEFCGTLGSAAIKVLNLEAGRTGISEKEAIAKGLNYKTLFMKDKNHAGYYPGEEDIYIKLIYDVDTRLILGGQIIGKSGAVLRVDVISTALYSKLKVDDLGKIDFCYAPPFSNAWDALNVAGNLAK